MPFLVKKSRAFKVSTRDVGAATVIELAGDPEKDGEARDRISEARDELRGRNRALQVVAGPELEQLTASALGALLGDVASVRRAKGDLVFAQLQPGVKPFFAELGLTDRFAFSETVEEGVADLEARCKEAGPIASSPLLTKTFGDKTRKIAIIELEGSLDERTVAGFEKTLSSPIEKDFTKIILDAAKLVNVHEDGLMMLVRVSDQQLRARGGALAIAGLWGVPLSLVRMLSLDQFFTLYPEMESAKKAFRG